jgi:hypothetical protein
LVLQQAKAKKRRKFRQTRVRAPDFRQFTWVTPVNMMIAAVD